MSPGHPYNTDGECPECDEERPLVLSPAMIEGSDAESRRADLLAKLDVARTALRGVITSGKFEEGTYAHQQLTDAYKKSAP